MYYHLCSVPVRAGVTAVAKAGKHGSVFSPVGQLHNNSSVFSPVGQLHNTSSVFSPVGRLHSTTQCGGNDCSAEVGEIPSYRLGVDAVGSS